MADAGEGAQQRSLWDRLACWRSGDQETVRTLRINGDEHSHSSGGQRHAYKGNYTSTTKYNLLTFLPIALYEQYRCVAAVLQPGCSNVQGSDRGKQQLDVKQHRGAHAAQPAASIDKHAAAASRHIAATAGNHAATWHNE